MQGERKQKRNDIAIEKLFFSKFSFTYMSPTVDMLIGEGHIFLTQFIRISRVQENKSIFLLLSSQEWTREIPS